MNVVLYAKAGQIGKRLMEVIARLTVDDQVETDGTIEDFSHRLRQSLHNIRVAVILATSGKEFSEILEIAHLMAEVRIILILPAKRKRWLSPRLSGENAFQSLP